MPAIRVISPMWPSAKAPYYGVFVRNMCAGLEQEGLAVEERIVLRRNTDPFSGALARTGFALSILGLVFRARLPLYVHAPSWFAPLVRLVSGLRAVPVAVHLHGSEIFGRSIVSRGSRARAAALARSAALVVVPSRFFADQTRQSFGVEDGKIFVSPSGGVDTSLFRPGDRAAARRALDLPERVPVLGFVGRLSRDKGWDTFLEVMEAVGSRISDVHGIVVAGGEESDAFKRQVENRGLGRRLVHMTAVEQARLPEIYSSMDLLLFPTRLPESLGLVGLEAMSCGIPVVGSRSGALPEYIEPPRNGRLCDSGDTREFVEATLAVLEAGPSARREMEAAARSTANSFAAEETNKKLAACLQARLTHDSGGSN